MIKLLVILLLTSCTIPRPVIMSSMQKSESICNKKVGNVSYQELEGLYEVTTICRDRVVHNFVVRRDGSFQ